MTTPPTRDVKIRLPQDFTGDRTKTNRFIQQVEVYLKVNPDLYDTDEKKIAFASSFMTDGPAATWAEAKISGFITTRDWGTWDDFKEAVKDAFKPVDAEGAARQQLKTLRQGSDSIDDYILAFMMLKTQSGITDENTLMDYFLDGLNRNIVTNLVAMEMFPDKLDKLTTAAAKFEQMRRRLVRAVEVTRAKEVATPNIKQEPNGTRIMAMEAEEVAVDRMSISERNNHMKRGLCFRCHQPGHMAKDHQKQGGQMPPAKRTFIRKKPETGKDAWTRIRGILTDLEVEARDEALNLLEREGF